MRTSDVYEAFLISFSVIGVSDHVIIVQWFFL